MRKVVTAGSLVEAMYLLDITNPQLLLRCMVNHGNLSNRIEACPRRWFIQVSALSAFDGRVLAYHGVNG